MIKLKSLLFESKFNIGPVYHGTDAEYDTFDISKIGAATQTVVRGFFFTDDVTLARKFGKRVIVAYLSLKNPMIIDAEGRNVRAVLGAYEEGNARENGKDGFIVKNVVDALGYVVSIGNWSSENTTNLFIVFDEHQIRVDKIILGTDSNQTNLHSKGKNSI